MTFSSVPLPACLPTSDAWNELKRKGKQLETIQMYGYCYDVIAGEYQL